MKESAIQRRVITRLRARGWHTETMSCNAYQKGIPDLYCFKRRIVGTTSSSTRVSNRYEELHRWVDVKRPKGGTLTKSQVQKWTLWEKIDLGVWIVTGEEQDIEQALLGPPNWREWWKPRYERWVCQSPADLLREFNDACDI